MSVGQCVWVPCCGSGVKARVDILVTEAITVASQGLCYIYAVHSDVTLVKS